jgi:hypothetical protein
MDLLEYTSERKEIASYRSYVNERENYRLKKYFH